MLAWTHSIANGSGDIAVVLVEPESLVPPTVCQADGSGDITAAAARAAAEAADGVWSRFFTPMAHLCVFGSQQVSSRIAAPLLLTAVSPGL